MFIHQARFQQLRLRNRYHRRVRLWECRRRCGRNVLRDADQSVGFDPQANHPVNLYGPTASERRVTGLLCSMPQIPVLLGVGTGGHGTGAQGNSFRLPDPHVYILNLTCSIFYNTIY